MSAFTQDEIIRYSRHFSVERIGIEGQKRLKASRVLLIGAGGIGSPAALYLTAMGIGQLGIIDHDTVDISNLQRQILYKQSNCGDHKVAVAKRNLNALNYHVDVHTYPIRLTVLNAHELMKGYDLIIDGSDNYPTRYLVNDISAELKIPLISASIFQFSGQLGLYNYKGSACYRCIYPNPPPEGLIPNCAAAGVLGTIPGILATMAATEAVKLLLDFPEVRPQITQYDSLTPSIKLYETQIASACPICSKKKSFSQLERFDSTEQALKVQTLSTQALANWLKADKAFHLVDVRQDWERAISALDGSINIPLHDLNPSALKLSKNDEIVIFCRSGVRSLKACEALLASGYQHVYNLEGGILDWAKTQDPTCTVY